MFTLVMKINYIIRPNTCYTFDRRFLLLQTYGKIRKNFNISMTNLFSCIVLDLKYVFKANEP